MYTEAGGSSSFAPRFNERVQLRRGLGTDAQLRDHGAYRPLRAQYLASSGRRLARQGESSPARSDRPRALNIVGSQERPRSSDTAVADLATQGPVAIGVLVVLSLRSSRHGELGVAPTWSDFALGIAVG